MVEATDAQMYSAVGTFLVVIIAFFTLLFSQRGLKKQLRAQIEIQFMDEYIKIQRTKSEAIKEMSPILGYQYYREMFDLHWTAHNLWKKGHINKPVMKAWLDIRRRNYEGSEEISVDREKYPVTKYSKEDFPTTYKATWLKLRDSNYFAPGDDFLNLMDKLHNTKDSIDQIMGEFEPWYRIW